MSASRASSTSDGVVVDTQRKANNVDQSRVHRINDSSRVSGLDGTFDRQDRPYRPLSRSPSPYRRKRTRSPSPYRSRRDRDRSPSPFRHRGRADRATEAKEAHSQQKRRTSPPQSDRNEKRLHTDRSRNEHRSRPFPDDVRTRLARVDIDHERQDFVRPPGTPISYAELERPNAVPNFKNGVLDSRARRIDGAAQAQTATGVQSQVKHIDSATNSGTKREGERRDVEMADLIDDRHLISQAEPEKIPTEESREEKRRRWAIKRAAAEQKVKENLLQQAVLTNASEATTPNVHSPRSFADASMSPFPSPQLGDLDSVPASPDVMVIDKQGVVSAGNSPAPDSPSAADYDPVQDMLNDRDRAAKKNHTGELRSDAYDETKAPSTLPAEKVATVKKQKKELDMFASDDEDAEAEAVDEEDDEAKGNILDEKLLDNWDDPEGFYKIIGNELLSDGRYRVIKQIGRGMYANVTSAIDTTLPANDAKQLVAIKIIRRNEMMRKASQKEMNFVRILNDADPHDKKHIIRLLGSFDHKGHLCILFEALSKNLRDLLKEETGGHGLSFPAVRIYAKQMFAGLQHLQNCQVLHLDLKPDNILVSADKKTIKLADFGTAHDRREDVERTTYLCSRFYRAPEIILGMELSYPIDMWAIGCTIYELWTGKILFNGQSNNQMVKAFMDCLGWPSEKLLRKGLANNVLDHFEFGSSLKFVSRDFDMNNKLSVRKIEQQKKISRDIKSRVHDAARHISSGGPSIHELNDLTDLLSACLHMNAEKRATPKEALVHRMFVSKTLAPKSAVVKPQLLKKGAQGAIGSSGPRR